MVTMAITASVDSEYSLSSLSVLMEGLVLIVLLGRHRSARCYLTQYRDHNDHTDNIKWYYNLWRELDDVCAVLKGRFLGSGYEEAGYDCGVRALCCGMAALEIKHKIHAKASTLSVKTRLLTPAIQKALAAHSFLSNSLIN